MEEPFTAADLDHMRALGIDPAKALSELERFRKGQTYATLERACAVGDGIVRPSRTDLERWGALQGKAASEGRFMQFVPASGAATRMFKALLTVLNRKDNPDFQTLIREGLQGDPVAEEFLAWFQGLDAIPFREELVRGLRDRGLNLESLIEAAEYRPILECLLAGDGLGYADRPKALIPFHVYPEGPRLALEEHLAEAKVLVRDGAGICRLHFTVSPAHKVAFMKALERALDVLESDGTHYRIGISEQDPATDTLAVDEEGKPFRDPDGSILFRPGGHGALLENLQECAGDLVFIKNIDNIVPDPLRPEITEWRRIMGGLLVETQSGISRHLDKLRTSQDPGSISEAARFAEGALGIILPDGFKDLTGEPSQEKARAYLIRILDRPVRVCAMVENLGEPGGGPFWVRHTDGSLRLQIVETPQVDPGSAAQKAIAGGSGFFNPTDMVCGLRNPAGAPFRLQDFTDPEAGFITSKSKDGRNLKALELPGLWNGSMAEWNSVFVEAPASIFNPVKTVIDLLRPAHVNHAVV
ncbi:MAG: conserved hypothetical cytosolic protein [Fibrobacteres bacterium]|nr:conserved hypothetical cytosolic protein [Fibrobacterota bacterium]